MKNFILLFCALSIFLNLGCNFEPDIQWNKVDQERFQIEVPEFMIEHKELNEEAILQYANLEKEMYVMIIEESAAEFEEVFSDTSLGIQPNMQGFSDLVYEDFQENSAEGLVSIGSRTQTKMNKFELHTFEAVSKVDSVEAFYVFGVARSDSSYYQICAWTLANLKDKNQADLHKIVASFQPK
jgi:hypothetical protein